MATAKVEASTSAAKSSRSLLNLRTLSLVLVVLGLFVSGYLSYAHLTNTQVVCTAGETFNCDVVQNSLYSKMFGIPVAYLGLLTYVTLGLLILLQDRIAVLRSYGLLLTFGLTLLAFLFSMYLVYVQGALLGAWCVWCLAHEVIMTVLFIVTGIRLVRYMRGNLAA